MTNDQIRVACGKFLAGRAWVKCGTCDTVLTVKTEKFTVYPKDPWGDKAEIKCGPCEEDEDADL